MKQMKKQKWQRKLCLLLLQCACGHALGSRGAALRYMLQSQVLNVAQHVRHSLSCSIVVVAEGVAQGARPQCEPI